MRWDEINKWLYIGSWFVLQFDNWHWYSRIPTIRQWCLFEIQYDNGAWWSDIREAEDISLSYMDDDKIGRANFAVRDGMYPCYVQITILGVGLRFYFSRRLTVCNRRLSAGKAVTP